MATNINEFLLNLKLYDEQTLPELARNRVTAVCMEATKGVVELTPVDTGRLKGNWQASVGGPKEGSIERFDKTATGSSASSPAVQEAAEALQDWEVGQWFWLHNGVPYATYQEDGTEAMPGKHMVKRTVSRIERSFAR